MEKEKIFDLAVASADIALSNVKESKEKYFNPQKSVRIFAVLATLFVVAKEVYDLFKTNKEDENE